MSICIEESMKRRCEMSESEKEKPKCLNCGIKLKGEPHEYNNCCCYACWKKWKIN